ncbi:protease inhibitor I42 family protein [Abyssisolibacter fermentans]|uniref:protease inhibitor I42 family protein n=1 Tax=Abyssisolibacter fermentans TaxID=1766203 RepID=UPI0008355E0E|nr:protease inhibitor I42 family protein [Abyssisolibacter fermentans]
MENKGICLNEHFINKMNIDGELGWFMRDYNASTGYTWSCIPDNSGVYEMVENIVLHPSTDAVGVSGMIIWKFKAVREGKGTVMFELYPPAKKEPAATIVVEIEVN